RLRPRPDHRLDRVHYHPLGARPHVANPECGTRAVLVSLELDRAVGNLPREGEPATVGGDLGCGGATAREAASRGAAALARGHVDRLAGLELEAAKLQRSRERLVIVHRHRDLIVDEPPVAGDTRPR